MVYRVNKTQQRYNRRKSALKTKTVSRTGWAKVYLQTQFLHKFYHFKKVLKINKLTKVVYSTAWTEWSSCTLHENSECGVGWKERVSECQRSDGVTVDVSYCSQRWVEVGVPQLQSCTVPCLVNCVMNDWTRWSECDSVCGRSRRRSRTRNVQEFIIIKI